MSCLPDMDRVGKEKRICFACLSLKKKAVVEDVHHFLMECPMYEAKRNILLDRAAVAHGSISIVKSMSSMGKELILLGKRFKTRRIETKTKT